MSAPEITMHEPKTPGYLFQFTANMGNGMQLNVNGNFAVGASTADMNTEVDKVKGVFDRLRAQHEVGIIEANLEEMRRQLVSQEFDLQQTDARNGDRKLSGQDSINLQRMRQQITATKIEITKGEIKLVELKAKAV